MIVVDDHFWNIGGGVLNCPTETLVIPVKNRSVDARLDLSTKIAVV